MVIPLCEQNSRQNLIKKKKNFSEARLSLRFSAHFDQFYDLLLRTCTWQHESHWLNFNMPENNKTLQKKFKKITETYVSLLENK